VSLTWSPGPATAAVGARTADVWRVHLPVLPGVVDRSLLASARRSVLARYVGGVPAALSFETSCRLCGDERHGKPRLLDDPQLDFNSSRSGPWALVAVTRGAVVGVDVEGVERMACWDEIAAVAMADIERRRLAEIGRDLQPAAAARSWTCKEAVAKAAGWGLAADLRAIVGTRGGAGEPVLEAVPPGWGQASSWTLFDADPGLGHPGTVALGATDAVLRAWDLT